MADEDSRQIVKTRRKNLQSNCADNVADRPPRTKRKAKQKRQSSGVDNPNFNNSNGLNGVSDEANHDRSPLDGAVTAESSTKRRRRRPSRSGRGSTRSLQSANGLDQTGNLSATSVRSKRSAAPTEKKKTKRKRVKSPVSGTIESLGVDMADIQDDIMDASTDPDSEQDNIVHQHMMRSQPVGKLYIEQSRGFISVRSPQPLTPPVITSIPPAVEYLKLHLHLTNGFKATDKAAMEEMYEGQRTREMDTDEMSFPVKTTGMAFAVQTVQAFKTLAHFCMGILAGFAVWQTIYAYLLTSNPNLLDSILDLYQYSSIPINSVFYILLVVTAVATFDRYDIAKLNRRFLLRAFTLQSGAIACVLYTAALCVNVSLAPLEDRLGVRINVTFDTSREFTSNEERDSHLMSWKVLTVVRAVLITLAWFIISIRPATNRIVKNLGHSEVTWANSTEQQRHVTSTDMEKQQNNV